MRSRVFRTLLFYTLTTSFLGVVCASGWAGGYPGGLRFAPLFSYTPDGGFGGGAAVSYLYPRGRHSVKSGVVLGAFVLYTRDDQYSGELKWDHFWWRIGLGSTLNLPVGKYLDRYYGIGNDTRSADADEYIHETATLRLALRKMVSPGLAMGIGYEFGGEDISDVRDGGLLDDPGLTGADGGVITGFGTFLVHDTRDSRFYPSAGGILMGSIWIFTHAVGSDFDFGRYVLDVRRYVSPVSNHVVAFQALLRLMSGEPPFTMLSRLGGQGLLQAYGRGRYRDMSLFALQSEYRMPLIWRFGVTLSAGVGDVFDRAGDISPAEFKYSLGAGLRLLLNSREKIHLRIDYATGVDSSGFYLGLYEAF